MIDNNHQPTHRVYFFIIRPYCYARLNPRLTPGHGNIKGNKEADKSARNALNSLASEII
jgi:hypothetical protein